MLGKALPRLAGIWAALALCGGCVGAIGEDQGPPGGLIGATPSVPDSQAAPGIRPGAMSGAGGAPAGLIGESSRLPFPVGYRGMPSPLRRLSRDEIVASALALTGAAPRRDDLPEEPRPENGALLTGGMSFIAGELGKLRLALSDFAAQSAPATLTGSTCAARDQPQRDCLLRWATGLAERGWRRRLDETETGRFRKLLEMAGSTRDLDLVAVEGVLSSIFFSPSFLYRTEVGTPVPGQAGVRLLDGVEVATRLGFLATLAPPDADLLDAARAGRLGSASERTKQLARLLKTEGGRKALAVLVLEWLGAGESKGGEKSSRYRSGLGADFDVSSRTSAELAVRRALDGAEPTVGALLTTESYLADPIVQKIRQPAGMGKPASGDPDAGFRLGLIMHPHVLAAHTKEDGVSPFSIGLFLRQALLCESVPQPPANAAALAPQPPAGLTVREDLEFRTTAGPACKACHSLFSPLGYAFLPFDPVGRWVKEDSTGKPWNLEGSVDTFAGVPLTFQSPAELVRTLAQRPQVQGCFAQAVVEWTLGRHLVEKDRELLQLASAAAARTNGSVPAVLEAIVGAPGFVNTVVER